MTSSSPGPKVGPWQAHWMQLPATGPACYQHEALGTFPDRQKEGGGGVGVGMEGERIDAALRMSRRPHRSLPPGLQYCIF